MIPEPKLFKHQLDISCKNLKNEMHDSINDENIRTNIDSAKKRAVLYGFDYSGFR
jgi:hypothetical protein